MGMSWTRMKRWFRRRPSTSEMREELDAHVAMRAAHDGTDEASARRRFGNMVRTREAMRRVWIAEFVDTALQDARFTWRSWRRNLVANSTFTLLAISSLALGIGANVAFFSVLEGVLFRALPVSDPGSLVLLQWHSRDYPGVVSGLATTTSIRDPEGGFTAGAFPFPAIEAFDAANSNVLSSLFAFSSRSNLSIIINSQAELVDSLYVSGEFFPGLGIAPAVGRLLDARDDQTRAPVVAISYPFWRDRFGASPDAIGTTIEINDLAFTIVGATPEGFYGVDPSQQPKLYFPLQSSALVERADTTLATGEQFADRNFYWLQLMGRLRQRVRLEEAHAALAPLFAQFVSSTAVNDRQRTDLPVLRLQKSSRGLDSLRSRLSDSLYIVTGFVTFFLLVACTNLSNLLLARTSDRHHEVAVRMSLGSGRVRLVRQFLAENVVLAVVAGAISIPVAFWCVRLVTMTLGNGNENFTLHAELNWYVLLFALALSLVVGLLIGLAPALQTTRVELHSLLQEIPSQRLGSIRRSARWLSVRNILLCSQVTLSVLILTACGLFIQTLANLRSVDLGLNSGNVLLTTLNGRQAGYENDLTTGELSLLNLYDRMRREFMSIPGVESVTVSDRPLVSGVGFSRDVTIPGLSDEDERNSTSVLRVGPSFFTTMQIPMLLGREITEFDNYGAVPVAVVNNAFAERYFPNESPVGRSVQFGQGRFSSVIRIVGMSQDARYSSLRDDIPPVVYLPYWQNVLGMGPAVFAIRTVDDPLSASKSVRAIVRQMDDRIPVASLLTQTMAIERTMGREMLFSRLSSGFAIMSLVILCVGVFGLISYSVSRRKSEIALRIALGAKPRSVVWLVLGQTVVVVGVGLVIGLVAAFASTRLVSSFLFGISPYDPPSLAIASAGILLSAIGAGYAAASHAARIEPMSALRS